MVKHERNRLLAPPVPYNVKFDLKLLLPCYYDLAQILYKDFRIYNENSVQIS